MTTAFETLPNIENGASGLNNPLTFIPKSVVVDKTRLLVFHDLPTRGVNEIVIGFRRQANPAVSCGPDDSKATRIPWEESGVRFGLLPFSEEVEVNVVSDGWEDEPTTPYDFRNDY